MARVPARYGHKQSCRLGMAIVKALGSVGNPRSIFGSVVTVQGNRLGAAEVSGAVISWTDGTGDLDISEVTLLWCLSLLDGLGLRHD